MKTIFYKQNQLSILKKNHMNLEEKYVNPSSEDIDLMVHQFINTNSFNAFIVDETGLVYKRIKNKFTYLEAAGGLVLNNKEALLLIKRLGYWDLPKGKLESNETKEQGAMREVEEECGIKGLLILKPLKPSYHIYSHNEQWILKKTHWFLMRYKGFENLTPQVEENITEVKWVNLKDLKNYLENTYPAIIKVLHQLQFPLE
jgi:8-oxo-dGTP pyrophosphatase MutT (NUDIX family)